MKIYNIKRKMVFMDKIKNVDALYSIGILWNMGTKYADEIISEISQSVKLLKVRKYDLKEIYDTFVIDCYKGDDEAFLDGYIYDKIKNMKNAGNNKIFLFIVQINNPTYKLNTENGIITFNVKGVFAQDAGSYFNSKGIAVRTGLQCAPLAHKCIGTFPAGTIRFSVSHFTSEQDFQELKEALDFIEDNL